MIITKINAIAQTQCGLQSQENHNPIYSNLKSLKQDTTSFGSQATGRYAAKLVEIVDKLPELLKSLAQAPKTGEGYKIFTLGDTLSFRVGDSVLAFQQLDSDRVLLTIDHANTLDREYWLQGVISKAQKCGFFHETLRGAKSAPLLAYLEKLSNVKLD